MGRIKYLVMDVDGTLTDGKIYMGQDGEAAKAFDIKDGCGILLVLPKYDIMPVIITARKSKILDNRCKEIGVSKLFQGVSDKLSKLKEIVGEDLSSVAYAGDDLPDIPCMEAVKKCGGVVLCPSDAIPEVKALSNFISYRKAGEGAVRDCIHYLIQQKDNDNERRVRETINKILSGELLKQTKELQSDEDEFHLQEYSTRPEDDCVIESHRNHIDIQYMIEGIEEFVLYGSDCLTCLGKYDEEKDVEYWKKGIERSRYVLVPGSIVVVHNNQPHKGGILHNQSTGVKKIVYKIHA